MLSEKVFWNIYVKITLYNNTKQQYFYENVSAESYFWNIGLLAGSAFYDVTRGSPTNVLAQLSPSPWMFQRFWI